MSFHKLLKKIIFLTFLIINATFASDKPFLEGLPPPLIRYISTFLSDEENRVFRQVSKPIMKQVDKAIKEKFQRQLKTSINTNLPDLLMDLPEISPSSFNRKYTYKIMQEVWNDYLKTDGFLSVHQGSILEGCFNQHYPSVPLYGYLESRSEETKKLFKALFDKDIPEGKENLALHLLTGCLPSNHIYVAPEREDTDSCMAKFTEILLDSINKNRKITYFLLDIDEDFNVLKEREHVIVISQSTFASVIRELIDFPHETIILNADQKKLYIQHLTGKMKKLILVNGNKQCLSIGNEFMRNYGNLQFCSAKGLGNLEEIGNLFMAYCPNLITFNCNGLSKVKKIGSYFLASCKNLILYDIASLGNLEEIGFYFLAFCESLSTFNTLGLSKVQRIGDCFLYNCEKLISFNGKDFYNVENIGSCFLGNCKNLVSFDSTIFVNIQSLGPNFLLNCLYLDSKKIRDEIFQKKKKK